MQRWPFFEFCLTDGSAEGRSGGQGQTSQAEIYYRIVRVYSFKCFLLVLNSKGHAHTFFLFFWAGGWAKGRAGAQGQTSHTETYYRIVFFYSFKCFLLALQLNGHANLFLTLCKVNGLAHNFSKYVWRADMRANVNTLCDFLRF